MFENDEPDDPFEASIKIKKRRQQQSRDDSPWNIIGDRTVDITVEKKKELEPEKALKDLNEAYYKL